MRAPALGGRRSRARRARRSRRSGAALLLTLLVLAILVVLTVQLSFSVKVEESIVRNTEDDAAMELAAVRGGIHFVGALFRDDRANGVPPGDLDTAVDIMFDPNTPDQRKLTIGDVELTVELEDLERRLPLAWLADEQRKDLAEVALTRLIQKLQIEGDAAALAKQVADRVREIEGVEFAAPAEPGGTAPPAPAPTQGEGPRPRRFISLEQLLDPPASPDGEGGGAPPPPGGGAPGGGIDRKLLYGDPEADPPRVGLASFVTAWPVPFVNLNTVSAEVLFALLPEKNKADEALWEDADAIVEGIRGRRIDPQFQSKPADEGGTPPPTSTEEGGGGQGASQQWSGTAFTTVDELQSAEIHAKLAKIFTNPDAPGGGGGGGGGGGTPGVGGGGGTPAAGEEAFGFKNLLAVKSRYYMVRVTARRSGGDDEQSVEAVYRLMIMRGAADEVTPLFIAEAGAR